MTHAFVVHAVLAKLVFRQLAEQFAQRVVADGAKTTWREFDATFFAIDETRFFQHFGHFCQSLKRLRRLFAKDFAHFV